MIQLSTIDGIVIECLAYGVTGTVQREEEVIIKGSWPNNDDSLQELEVEARIYQNLGPHPRIVPFLSWDPEKSMLKTRYMKNCALKSYITSNQCSVEEKIRWIKQTADAIQACHIHEPKKFGSS